MTALELPAQHRPSIQHGTVSAYNKHGCRCDQCRTAASEYAKQRWQRTRPLASGTPGRGERHGWRDQAACREVGNGPFFTTNGETRTAKAICADCEVRGLCLAFALRTDQPDGVWGGLTVTERRQLRHRRVVA